MLHLTFDMFVDKSGIKTQTFYFLPQLPASGYSHFAEFVIWSKEISCDLARFGSNYLLCEAVRPKVNLSSFLATRFMQTIRCRLKRRKLTGIILD